MHLEAFATREVFQAFIQNGLAAAGAKGSLLADSAREILFRASRGNPRLAAKLLRRALRLAHEREQSFVDDAIIESTIAELAES